MARRHSERAVRPGRRPSGSKATRSLRWCPRREGGGRWRTAVMSSVRRRRGRDGRIDRRGGRPVSPPGGWRSARSARRRRGWRWHEQDPGRCSRRSTGRRVETAGTRRGEVLPTPGRCLPLPTALMFANVHVGGILRARDPHDDVGADHRHRCRRPPGPRGPDQGGARRRGDGPRAGRVLGRW